MKQLQNKSKRNEISDYKKALPVLLIIGISFCAANLRAPLTSVGPLISLIRSSLHISDTLAGMITTVPLFAFALFSPLVPGLARKFSTETVIFWSIITLTAGIFLRSLSGSFGLFLGTAILGLSIAAGNVLLPSLIKKEFPNRIGLMTGVYSVSMNLLAALASGISVPLAVNLGLGWDGALRVWLGLSLISAILWLPQLRKNNGEGGGEPALKNDFKKTAGEKAGVWKSPLAWQVTVYMGLQSMVFYCMVAWMPAILIQQGMNSGKAGFMLSLMQLALIPMTFAGSVLAGRRASQQLLVTAGSVCVIAGLLGLLLSGGTAASFFWIIILGIGGGLTFSLSMMFFSLRTANSDEAARLSGMAQAVGYLLAAFGPMLFGYLHDASGSFTQPLIILIGLAVICLLSGLGAARDLSV